jgi:NAD(P)-dependent dehydrogenase (short-subunit alcohol dehydrogenase family)
MAGRRSSSFRNRFVLVTGGSSGIGFALAAELLKQGAKVVIVGLHGNAVEDALARLGGRGPGLDAYVCDIAVPEDVERTAAAVVAAHGHPDILVNNAGFATYRTFEQSDAAEIERLLSVNFGGAVRMTKAFLAGMISRRSGQIIMVASIAGRLGITPNAVYCAAKHGMLAWSQCLALELKRFGISVGVICPGRVETSFFDHETFRKRRQRKEAELTVSMPVVVDAIIDTIERRLPLRHVPRYFGLLAWMTRSLGPVVQGKLDKIMLSRIEDLYDRE